MNALPTPSRLAHQARQKSPAHTGSAACLEQGISFLELLIVIALVAILTKVGFGMYAGSVIKAHRGDAMDMFIQIQQAQERYRTNNTTYASTLQALVIKTNVSANGYYTVALSDATSTGYVVTASAVVGSGQTNDKQSSTDCSTLVLTVSNGTPTHSPAACWSK